MNKLPQKISQVLPSWLMFQSEQIASKTTAFYDNVLATLGAVRIVQVPGFAIAWDKQFPEFRVQIPYNQQAAETANGVHFAFLADSKEVVDQFYKTALDAGAKCGGEPVHGRTMARPATDVFCGAWKVTRLKQCTGISARHQ